MLCEVRMQRFTTQVDETVCTLLGCRTAAALEQYVDRPFDAVVTQFERDPVFRRLSLQEESR